MTHDIDPDTHYVADESAVWEYTIEENGTAKNVSGGAIKWYLVPEEGDPDSDALLDHTDSGVTAAFTTDGSDGRVDVSIDRGVTAGMAGMYWQRLVVDDASTGRQIWRGPFPIDDA